MWSWGYTKKAEAYEFSNHSPGIQYPHCNTEVLHAPGQCKYCDKYPDWQQVRIKKGEPFANDDDTMWHGNVAKPEYNVQLDESWPYTFGEFDDGNHGS